MNIGSVNLYLDDLRECTKGFKIVRTVGELQKYLEEYNVNILSLDHDLWKDIEGNLLPTGYDFVKYFCKEGLKVNKI